MKQASPGSCGGPFPEAGGSFQKLVASRGWWHPEAGGIQRLVASGGWWWWECHHYHGWVDFFHFLQPEVCAIAI